MLLLSQSAKSLDKTRNNKSIEKVLRPHISILGLEWNEYRVNRRTEIPSSVYLNTNDYVS